MVPPPFQLQLEPQLQSQLQPRFQFPGHACSLRAPLGRVTSAACCRLPHGLPATQGMTPPIRALWKHGSQRVKCMSRSCGRLGECFLHHSSFVSALSSSGIHRSSLFSNLISTYARRKKFRSLQTRHEYLLYLNQKTARHPRKGISNQKDEVLDSRRTPLDDQGEKLASPSTKRMYGEVSFRDQRTNSSFNSEMVAKLSSDRKYMIDRSKYMVDSYSPPKIKDSAENVVAEDDELSAELDAHDRRRRRPWENPSLLNGLDHEKTPPFKTHFPIRREEQDSENSAQSTNSDPSPSFKSPAFERQMISGSQSEKNPAVVESRRWVQDEAQLFTHKYLQHNPSNRYLPPELRIQTSRYSPYDSQWSNPDEPVPTPGSATLSSLEIMPDKFGPGRETPLGLFPWEETYGLKDEDIDVDVDDLDSLRSMSNSKVNSKMKEKKEKIPTKAELTLPPDELQRLRNDALSLRQRVKLSKSGISDKVVRFMHDIWRDSELVKIKSDAKSPYHMKKYHEDIESLSGGLVVMRTGGVLVVYRGRDYTPQFLSPMEKLEKLALGQPELAENTETRNENDSENLLDNLNQDEKVGDSKIDYIDYRSVKNKEIDMKYFSSSNLGEIYQDTRGMEGDSEENVKEKTEGDEDGEREIDITEGYGEKVKDWNRAGFVPIDADLLIKKYDLMYKSDCAVKNHPVANDLGDPVGNDLMNEVNNTKETVQGTENVLSEEKICLPPFRLYPHGVRHHLNNTEMTKLRRLGRKLQVHFMLGKNRGLEGLAESMVKLWEKTELIKIGLKKVQNLSNQIIAEELKNLTGGVLLSRDPFYLLFYRGKDFVPVSLGKELKAQQEGLTNDEQTKASNSKKLENWLTEEEIKQKNLIADEAKKIEELRRIERKILIAQRRIERAKIELAKIEEGLKPIVASMDKEKITHEEQYMFKRLGQKMKAYLELGKRGVFSGVIENMHMHWKHRELVKVIIKEKDKSIAVEMSELMERESGGILVCVEPIKKYFFAIFYRGKNYFRPAEIRPRHLLSKRQALKRALERQRQQTIQRNLLEMEARILNLRQELSEAEIQSGLKEGEFGGEFRKTGEEGDDTPSVAYQRLEMLENNRIETLQAKYEREKKGREERQKIKEIEKEARRLRMEEAMASVIYRAPPLTTSQRLTLRDKALKMGKKSSFQVGHKNVVAGLAKAIRVHFLKSDLVKVGIKGRGKGTPPEEIIRQLEESTGGIMVSREPNKVILYRGWPAGTPRPDEIKKEEISEEMKAALEEEENQSDEGEFETEYEVASDTDDDDDDDDDEYEGRSIKSLATSPSLMNDEVPEYDKEEAFEKFRASALYNSIFGEELEDDDEDESGEYSEEYDESYDILDELGLADDELGYDDNGEENNGTRMYDDESDDDSHLHEGLSDDDNDDEDEFLAKMIENSNEMRAVKLDDEFYGWNEELMRSSDKNLKSSKITE